MKIKKVIYHEGHKYYWQSNDLHTEYGVVKEKDILTKTKVKSNLKKQFSVLPASLRDNIEKLKRGPAIMLPKDIGLILTLTGITKESEVLEAGSGSGFLTVYLANFCKKLYSYENNKAFYRLTKTNIESLDLKNVVLKHQDIAKGIKERNLDLAVLDLLNPEKYLKQVEKTLKLGAYLVAYLPHVTQVIEFLKKTKKYHFLFIQATELLQRNWIFEGVKARPSSKMIAHTAFLVFLRKI
ncbi:methyltransferase domain-containing protein [Candidatus Woesearchaeota archaeon]|nr:methyltransferase domain-containing protein [Candidatus Woesearchaeota archaeon]